SHTSREKTQAHWEPSDCEEGPFRWGICFMHGQRRVVEQGIGGHRACINGLQWSQHVGSGVSQLRTPYFCFQ
ncbi:hypothetical protein TorRG33x02_325560, partial [Trema orientale]